MSQTVSNKITITNQSNTALCKVCGDRASGKHYGVPSCDGCRGFFKRSIRRNLEYHCKEGGKCIVDVSRRNQCQACRFSKCLKANMRREAVQHERAPRSCIITPPHHLNGLTSDIYTAKRLSSQYSATPCNYFHFPLHSSNLLSPKISSLTTNFRYNLHSVPFAFGNISNPSLNSSVYLDWAPAEMPILKEDEVTSSEVTSTVEPSLYQLNSQHLRKEAVYESAAKLLFLAVKWARSIPSFNNLPLRDQTILLENSWAELFIVTASQWGLNLEILSNDKNIESLQNFINKYLTMHLNQTESACLKALILFNPDYRNVTTGPQILSIQDQTLNLLFEKSGLLRFGHILMLLPQIKITADAKNLQEILFKGTVGEVAIERILADLININ